jgi:hypothetical protein
MALEDIKKIQKVASAAVLQSPVIQVTIKVGLSITAPKYVAKE